MTVNEAAETFPGEWIFMQVTEQDEHGHAAAGIVLAHHRSRKVLAETEVAVLKAAKESPPLGTLTFTTYNGPLFCSTAEWRDYRARRQAEREAGR